MVKRAERKKRITRQRREQILEAALHIFSKHGFDRATIPAIAREAGIAVGTIYNYFESKRDLLLAITNRYVIEPFVEFIKHSRTEGDTAFITALMQNRIDFGFENISRFLPIFYEMQKDDELRNKFNKEVLRPVMNLMENLVRSRTDAGAFRKVNPKILTRAIGGMIIGFLILYRVEGKNSPMYGMDRKEVAGEMAGFIFRGLRKD